MSPWSGSDTGQLWGLSRQSGDHLFVSQYSVFSTVRESSDLFTYTSKEPPPTPQQLEYVYRLVSTGLSE